MADAADLKSAEIISRVGSTPTRPTLQKPACGLSSVMDVERQNERLSLHFSATQQVASTVMMCRLRRFLP